MRKCVCVYVCVCACVRARTRVRACVRVCVCVKVREKGRLTAKKWKNNLFSNNHKHPSTTYNNYTHIRTKQEHVTLTDFPKELAPTGPVQIGHAP